ncbi:MAG: mannosyltransferase family protein [Anaerolineales bacterium]|jgi:hypothetical protein|nr:mannosyltransferase family protein [Anaerolineales bacterium]
MKQIRQVVFTIILMWVGWFVILFGIQSITAMRLNLERPDEAVAWSAQETTLENQIKNPLLADPFMNEQVAWDSEYYLSITLYGYDDDSPGMDWVKSNETGEQRSLNYAFFPLYPQVMKAFYWIVKPFTHGLTELARAVLAGVITSLLGTLAAMFALYDLLRDSLDENERLRAVFYFLVFPSSFFLAMVYTEGLFMGITFWVLALSKRGKWGWASLLAILAPWTRAVGAALAVALAVRWLMSLNFKRPIQAQLNRKFFLQGLFATFPGLSYYAWRFSDLGRGWEVAQQWFGRAELDIAQTIGSYTWQLEHAASHPAAQVYFALEFFCLGLALLTTLIYLRRDPAIALFGLAVILLSALSGGGQGLARYVLPVPAIYLVLAQWGKNPAFDRTWTLASVFTMGLSAVLFAFDFWVG